MNNKRSDENNLNLSEINPVRQNTFFCDDEVKRSKNPVLKERLRTLCLERGMTEAEFYNSIGLYKQLWYSLSWGLEEPNPALKIKIASALGVDTSVIWRPEDD